jgi:signal transduction histidine kinase
VRTRRWLTVLVPVAVVGTIEALSDSALDELLPFPRDTLLVVSVVAVLAVIGGWFAWRSIDRLTATLERRNRELESRAATTRALHQVGLAIAALADLDAILQVIVDSARGLLGADVAVLVRSAPDGLVRLAAASGPSDLVIRDPDRPDDVRCFIAERALVSELAAPLRRGDATVGTLAIGAGAERAYGIEAIETLAALASQASIAIENARLQDRLREVAVRGERERIARELHDGLAQVLGYVNTKSQAVEELLSTGRPDDARAHLAELAAAARSVYVDVREAILGLSSPVLEGSGLVPTLERYADRFAEASKLAVVVRATDRGARAELSPAAEAQAFRIVQEALTNIRKHAAAHRVELSVDARDGCAILEVRDDGRGMGEAGSGDGWPRYGIVSMRQRAGEVGGTVVWERAEGGGTCVRLSIPLEPRSVGARTA